MRECARVHVCACACVRLRVRVCVPACVRPRTRGRAPGRGRGVIRSLPPLSISITPQVCYTRLMNPEDYYQQQVIELTRRVWALEARVHKIENPHPSVLVPWEPLNGLRSEEKVAKQSGLEGSE